MRRLPLLASLLLLAAPAAAQTEPRYTDLLARVQAGDTTVDYTALRLAYASSPAYSPYGSAADDLRDTLSTALERSDYARAIKAADAALAIDFLDVRTHVMRAYASGHSGDEAGAARHHAIAARLVASVTASGEGTERSPYVVVAVAEEYAVLGMTGYAPRDQTVGRCGGRRCDVIRAMHRETKAEKTFYFDITMPWNHLSGSLRQ